MGDSAPAGWDGWSGRRLLTSFAGQAGRAFEVLCTTVPVSPAMAAAARAECAETLGILGLPAPRAPGGSDAVDPAILAMARRFSTDVSEVDDNLRSGLTAACGRSTFEMVQTMYLADFAPRVMAALDALAGTVEPWIEEPPTEVSGAEFWESIEAFLRDVHRLDALDPVLSELVRLHGARQHNCRLCKSIRSRPALLAGADEQLFDAIDDDWSALPDRSRIALGLTDAMIWHPSSFPDMLVASIRGGFTPAEAVELVLDVMHNGANKIAVALAADGANVSDGLEIYEIDHDGVAHYGLALP
jgi:alkylhydroperoxidase family enzyme